jgi:3-hydroxyisobutyrate dehydrogenase
MKQQVCLIGLGMMGFPMAANLSKAGYPLWVADADPKRAQQFAEENKATVVTMDGADFPDLDVLITMLPNSAIVESVLLGQDNRGGVVQHLKQGASIIDMSSSEPLRSRELARQLQTRGLRFLDAPVSGGVKRATDGSLAIMAGGDKVVFDECADILKAMGKTIFHVDGPGAGHAVKALNNYVSAAGLIAAVEALQVGQRFGLDPDVMADVFNSSTGRNNTTENKVKQFMLSGGFNSGFSLQLMAKDLGIAMNLGKDLGYPMQFGDECLDVWASEAKALDRVADHTEMYKILANEK